jgi:catechol 2,3-dioxygenase-like lactoylglutathione lyase family enzyme
MKVVPMIHVPDVSATVRWYATLGFNPIRQNEENGEVNWALLSFGETELMFNAGGKLTSDARREVDLYVHAEGIDEMHARVKDRVQVVEAPYDTFYGMREFIIRDLNGFWLTFGEPAKA